MSFQNTGDREKRLQASRENEKRRKEKAVHPQGIKNHDAFGFLNSNTRREKVME